MRGKWARGIVPRGFKWIITDRLAVCERPGGCGASHRKVRRKEEIITPASGGIGTAPVSSSAKASVDGDP